MKDGFVAHSQTRTCTCASAWAADAARQAGKVPAIAPVFGLRFDFMGVWCQQKAHAGHSECLKNNGNQNATMGHHAQLFTLKRARLLASTGHVRALKEIPPHLRKLLPISRDTGKVSALSTPACDHAFLALRSSLCSRPSAPVQARAVDKARAFVIALPANATTQAAQAQYFLRIEPRGMMISFVAAHFQSMANDRVVDVRGKPPR